jgi:hypothetical protein
MNALPERRLIGAIIESAIADAKVQNERGLRAAEFLLSDRSDPYFLLLDIDPVEYRKGLVAYANTRVQLAAESSVRRILRNNLEKAAKIYGYELP